MDKKLVVPGETVSEERKRTGDNVIIRDGKIVSTALGLVFENDTTAGVIALEGVYIPKRGDIILGIIESEVFGGYIVDVNHSLKSFIPKKSMIKTLRKGNVISAKISEVNEVKEISVENVRVFYGGELIEAQPVKIPRMIGKNGSMLSVLKEGTGCSLMIGRNGWVWAKDGDINLLKKAIKKIEKEAHLNDLTNLIKKFLEKNKTKKVSK